MSNPEFGIFAVAAMALITFPAAFLIARLCLRGLIWMMTRGSRPAMR